MIFIFGSLEIWKRNIMGVEWNVLSSPHRLSFKIHLLSNVPKILMLLALEHNIISYKTIVLHAIQQNQKTP